MVMRRRRGASRAVPGVVRRRATVCVVALTLAAPLLGACGTSETDADGAVKPSKAALACREKWTRLGDDIESQVSATNPSALPQRWNSVAATVDYYRTTAKAGDCGERLDAQQRSISALKAFTPRLTVFDMQAQLALVEDDATSYAAGPWPAAHKGDGKKKTGVKVERPPKPADVGDALKLLTSMAPVATKEQAAGWEQASVIDLDDTAAVAKTLKDLTFLSSESAGWKACQTALTTIRAALAAKS